MQYRGKSRPEVREATPAPSKPSKGFFGLMAIADDDDEEGQSSNVTSPSMSRDSSRANSPTPDNDSEVDVALPPSFFSV
jgi:hypothetical protein